MVCLFCGNERKQTREHVIPQWLSTHIGDDIGADAYLWKLGDNPIERGPVLSRRLTDLILRRVCINCNYGWMSDLETEARPLLLPLIAGQAVMLNPETRTVLLRWALKTAAVLGPLQKAPDAIGAHIRRALVCSHDLGIHVALWAARTNTSDISSPHWR